MSKAIKAILAAAFCMVVLAFWAGPALADDDDDIESRMRLPDQLYEGVDEDDGDSADSNDSDATDSGPEDNDSASDSSSDDEPNDSQSDLDLETGPDDSSGE